MISIRRLEENDWETLRDVRLRALQTDPQFFGSCYDDEVDKSEDDWRRQLAFKDGTIFGLFDGEKPVGMTGVALDSDDPSRKTAVLWGSWIDPAYRGRGLSHLFYEARIAWAKAHPEAEKIVVSHRQSNEASKRANQKFGFQKIRESLRTWHDGVSEPDIVYELDCKP